MFGWEFPPLISGGLGTACYGMTKHLAESGEDVTFVLPRVLEHAPREGYELLSADQIAAEGETVELELPDRVTLLAVDSGLIPYTNDKDYKLQIQRIKNLRRLQLAPRDTSIIELSGHYSGSLFEEVERFAEVGRRLGRKNEFDIIHAHDWMTFPAAIAAQRFSQKPFIAHMHATEYDRTGDNPNPYILEVEKLGMSQADRILAVSGKTKRTLIERYEIPPEKIDIVHNAVSQERLVDSSEIQKRPNEKLIIFVGRITLQKGPEYFLRAAQIALKSKPHYRFVMCGAGDMLPRMIEEAARLRISKRFHFTGFLKGRDLDRLYGMADLFVMTSVSEPFGLTPFEAMRYNVPVIVSRQTGASELLPRAVQVDFWDTHRLARMMIDFCENEKATSALLRAQQSTLQSMSWGKVAEQLRAIYRKVLRI